MNYYERIQKSIDFIEENICEDISIEQCAMKSFMSVSGYYRMFFSIVGMNVKEYIRRRRLTLAFIDLTSQEKPSVMDMAVKYGFNTQDGFSRAFKKQFGILPSDLSDKVVNLNRFERIDIMEQFFECKNTELTDKYPDIKVIRELPEMKVACFTYFGKDPEEHAYNKLKEWFEENEVTLHDSPYRLFGYNNPDPEEGAKEYAYEYAITIPDEMYEKLEDVPDDIAHGVTYPKVYRKIIHSGKYAVLSVKREGEDIGYAIMAAWKRFINWIDESKYCWGHNQYLEEHLGFSENDDHIGGVDLYFSIEEDKTQNASKVTEVELPEMKVLEFREENEDYDVANKTAWGRAIEWLNKSGLKDEDVEIYQYNHGFSNPKVKFHVVAIKILTDHSMEEKGDEYEVKFYAAHSCASLSISGWPELGAAWRTLEKWCRKNHRPPVAQWFEKCEHEKFFPNGKVTCYLPI